MRAAGHYRYLQFVCRPAVPKSMWQSHIASAHPHNQRLTLSDLPTHRTRGPVTGIRAPRYMGHPRTTATARTRTHEGAPPQSHMQSLSCGHSHAHAAIARAQPDASPHARATAAKRRPRQKRVLESRLCRTPLQLLRVRAKIAPSEHAQAAGRQRVRTGEQQRACSGWVRAPSVAPVSSTNLRR